MKIKKILAAQTISEYVVVLTVIAAALSTMQLYFKRSIQAVVKVAADEIGSAQRGATEEGQYNVLRIPEEGQDINTHTLFQSSTTTDNSVFYTQSKEQSERKGVGPREMFKEIE